MRSTHITCLLLLSALGLAACDPSRTADKQTAEQASPAVGALSARERCEAIKSSVRKAGFADKVDVTCDSDYAYVASATYPAHDMMNGITGTNEQIPVPAPHYRAPIKLNPASSDQLTTIDGAVGVAVNGVPIYDYSTQGELDVHHYDPQHDTVRLGQLDNCGGHAGRGDDYHYHAAPTCMIATMANREDSPIIGWAYDGYPIYGDRNPDGSPIAEGSLDVCNGQADPVYGYRYHTSATPPYIIQCLVGEVDKKRLPRVAPLAGDNPIRADLRPPREGVENLRHTIAEDGSRTMSYSYQGEEYYVTYRPRDDRRNCYEFEQKTITHGGIVERGTFCRDDSGRRPRPPRPRNDAVQVHQAETVEITPGGHRFRLEAWADNWFSAYLGDRLLVEDSVPITTERSFNAEVVDFIAQYPLHLNLIIKDFRENDTGLEYIGTPRQQMGDGGFILQITDLDTNKVIAHSDNSWKCKVIHRAPLNEACAAEQNPKAGVAPCTNQIEPEPEGWMTTAFDDSQWPFAVEHSASEVGPKEGYNRINWAPQAKLIWGGDLKKDNTLLCRVTITSPGQ
ncbi:YHYH protein [Microbulbifer thermotolerans]|uniref:YHYH protein n=1 Tax=Microbulbifer thermotolerans TaxID=252514 RepID=UPI00224B3C39|nr:YHYH protein [Microbulbifer thermotolerans]MCX2840908.1 YHYH protein [Microbulbifer thermotolerans]